MKTNLLSRENRLLGQDLFAELKNIESITSFELDAQSALRKQLLSKYFLCYFSPKSYMTKPAVLLFALVMFFITNLVSVNSQSKGEDKLSDLLRRATIGWNTDWSKHSIEYRELLSGGPPRDGIPPIDQPKFIDNQQAEQWLVPNDPLIMLQLNGDARAYPLQILTWHEIVNDTGGEIPITITFCPLRNSAIAFE